MQTEKVMKVSFITNFLLSCLKCIVGFILKSSALVADGIHSFSDLVTDVVAIVGEKLANKPKDKEHPYGHGKAEYIFASLIGILMTIASVIMIKNSILSLLNNVQLEYSIFLIIICVINIVIKITNQVCFK